MNLSSLSARPAAAIGALLLLMTGLAAAPEPAEAHSMYRLNPVSGQVFVPAGSFREYFFYQNQGPANVDWTIDTLIGLNGGDRYQDVYFYYFLYDRALTDPTSTVGHYGAPVRDWVQPGPLVLGGTITAHTGGNMDLWIEIYSQDIYDQSFNVYARARHP
jgi:hypothetical protein